jgi:hypothetical protein
MSEEEWISVLKLSTMWEFLDTRELAITELSNRAINPITMALLARRYKCPKWLHAVYQDLVIRRETISRDEAQQLGWDVAIRIFHIRDKTLTKLLDDRAWGEEETSGPIGQSGCIGEDDINRVFAEELKEVSDGMQMTNI